MGRLLAGGALVGAACASCAHGVTDPASGADAAVVARRDLTAAERQTVQAANGFAFNLLREVGADYAGRNVVLSPYSGTALLSMVLNGAAGETLAGVQRALGTTGQSVDATNATYQTLTSYLLGADAKVAVRSANSVWADQTFAVRPAFADALAKSYAADARTVAFGSQAATDAINAWASQKTDGKVPKVFDPGQPERGTVLVLINALYFKGQWATQFDAGQTAARPFALAGGATVSVPTMSRDKVAMRLGSGADGAQVGELPYGGGAYVMTVVLPPEGADLSAYAAGLTAAKWDALVATLHDASAMVQLPKFTLSGETRWNAPLARLGMDAAFDGRRADFSGLSAQCAAPGAPGTTCYVSFVKQNVFVQVDEEGTTAAAVTSGGFTTTSLGPSLFVNRPFLFAVRERASGAVLFVGRVLDPRGT